MVVDEEPEQDPKLLPDARLDRLEQRLARAKTEEAARTGQPRNADASEQLGSRVLSYLLGGLLGGALIGWLLDGLFDTGHLLLIVGLVLGAAGGFWSIIKLSLTKTKKDDPGGR